MTFKSDHPLKVGESNLDVCIDVSSSPNQRTPKGGGPPCSRLFLTKKIFGDLLSGRPLSSRPRIFSQTMASSPLSLSLSLLVAESCFGPALTPERDPRRNTAVAVSHDSECGKRTNVTTHRADVGEALQRWDFAVSMNLLQQVFFFGFGHSLPLLIT